MSSFFCLSGVSLGQYYLAKNGGIGKIIKKRGEGDDWHGHIGGFVYRREWFKPSAHYDYYKLIYN